MQLFQLSFAKRNIGINTQKYMLIYFICFNSVVYLRGLSYSNCFFSMIKKIYYFSTRFLIPYLSHPFSLYACCWPNIYSQYFNYMNSPVANINFTPWWVIDFTVYLTKLIDLSTRIFKSFFITPKYMYLLTYFKIIKRFCNHI